MKATPELLQRALRNLEIGLSPEISAKILATVRLLDGKGAEANLEDFALIEACYTEKIEPQSEPLPSETLINAARLEPIKGIDLSTLEAGDNIKTRNESWYKITGCVKSNQYKGVNIYLVELDNEIEHVFLQNGLYGGIADNWNFNDISNEPHDIVKITNQTK